MHLGICVPGEDMPMESVRSYGKLMMTLCTQPPRGFLGVSQHMFASSMLPFSRAKVIAAAIERGASHLLLLDSDMTYPPDTVHRLLSHGRPFVACNAVTRRPPIRWVAQDKDRNALDSNTLTGLGKADTCGVAVALIEARVFEKIDKPMFDFEFTETGWLGEDIYFCRKVKAAGFQPMIDHDLSREIGHVGTQVFTGADV